MPEEALRPKIFISHIAPEQEIAAIFKGEIDRAFLGMVDVFLSSEASSIGLGQNWLDEITNALRDCAAMLVLCSPYSIGRPWINFECGAGWARAIEIAPLCHSGLRPVDLPLPICLLQGMEASDPNKIERVFALISAKLKSKIPAFDKASIAARIKAFEEKYVEETEIVSHLRALATISRELFDIMCKLPAKIVQSINGVPEQLVIASRPHFEALQTRKVLSYSFVVSGLTFGGTAGIIGNLTMSLEPQLVRALTAVKNEP